MDKQPINMLIDNLQAQLATLKNAKEAITASIEHKQLEVQELLKQEVQITVDTRNVKTVIELLRRLREGEEIELRVGD